MKATFRYTPRNHNMNYRGKYRYLSAEDISAIVGPPFEFLVTIEDLRNYERGNTSRIEFFGGDVEKWDSMGELDKTRADCEELVRLSVIEQLVYSLENE